MNKERYRIIWNEIIRFIDDFRLNPLPEKLKYNKYQDKIEGTFYAGVVEMLAKEQGLKIPSWVYNKKYYLSEPVFMGGFKGEYRILIMIETPLIFKIRNIFIGKNTFDRV